MLLRHGSVARPPAAGRLQRRPHHAAGAVLSTSQGAQQRRRLHASTPRPAAGAAAAAAAAAAATSGQQQEGPQESQQQQQQQEQQEQQEQQQEPQQQQQQQQQQQAPPPQQQQAVQQQRAATQGTAPEAAHAQTTHYVYTLRLPQPEGPEPVQLPPGGVADASAPQTRVWFPKSRYRPPSFLAHWPAPRKRGRGTGASAGGAAGPAAAAAAGSAGSAPAASDAPSYNFMSFLGSLDPDGGKYLVPRHALHDFLTPYFNTLHFKGRRMFLVEVYQEEPFKFFQELDFPWQLDPGLVAALVPRVVAIVSEEVGAAYGSRTPPVPLLSMRTIYKVHLNFPLIFTFEVQARRVRKAIINRCRAELSGQPPLALLKQEAAQQEHVDAAQAALRDLQALTQQLQAAGQLQELLPSTQALLAQLRQPTEAAAEAAAAAAAAPPPPPQQQQQPAGAPLPPLSELRGHAAALRALDWEAVVDFPHGSLRLLGSCKAPWMDGDPAWVAEKTYLPARFEGGVWMRQPLALADVLGCSILLTESELRVYEQGDEFMRAAYEAVEHREKLLAAKRLLRGAQRECKKLQQAAQQGGLDPAEAQPQPTEQQQDSSLSRRKQKAAAAQAAARERQRERQRKAQQALAQMQAAAGAAAFQRASRPQLVRPSGLLRPLQPADAPPAAESVAAENAGAAEQQGPGGSS